MIASYTYVLQFEIIEKMELSIYVGKISKIYTKHEL